MALKIGVISWPTLANKCALDKVCPERGYLVDATRVACDMMRLNCSFSWFTSGVYGIADDNGVGTGLVGAIQRGEYDTSIPTFAPTYIRYKAISFGEPFEYEDILLVTRAPQGEQDIDWSIVSAYHWQSWTAFAIILFLAACLLRCGMRWTQENAFAKKLSVDAYFDSSMSLIRNDFENSHLKSKSVRLLVVVWILGAVVLTSAYSGKLFSQKVLLTNKLPYTDLETFVQCLESSDCRIITPDISASTLQQLIGSNDHLAVRIQKSLKYNQAKITPVVGDILRAILEEKSQYLVFLLSKTATLSLTSGNRDCLYYTIEMNYAEIHSFPFAKNSTHSNTLNKITLAFREFGLMKILKQRYIKESICSNNWKRGRAQSSLQSQGLSLMSLTTAFGFLALGVFIAVVTFLIEKLVSRCCSSNAVAAPVPVTTVAVTSFYTARPNSNATRTNTCLASTSTHMHS